MACEVQSPHRLSDMLLLQPFTKSILNYYPTFSSRTTNTKQTSKLTTSSHFRVVSRLPSIPPEVVRIVLQHVLNESRNDFLSALQVSRTWASVGKPLLWRDVVLTSANFASLSAAVLSSPQAALCIQHLTIRLQKGFISNAPVPNSVLSWLMKTMKSLSNLKTLSLVSSRECTRLESVVNREFLSTILQGMPQSVTSLELDLISAAPKSTERHEICNLLCRMLPQLQHLRLNRGVWCGHMFEGLEQRCPNLESVIINDCRRQYTTNCEQISSEIWRSDLIGESIALAAQKVIEAGYMPALKSFDVIVKVDLDRTMSTDAMFSCFQRKDVLNAQTTSYPLALISNGQTRLQMIRYRQGEETTEAFGEYDDVSVFVEAQSQTWIETMHGVRHPAAFKNSRQCKAGIHEWKEPVRLEMQPDKNIKSKLWTWEEICGRKLLRAKQHEGLGRGQTLMRDICDEESDPSLAGKALNETQCYDW